MRELQDYYTVALDKLYDNDETDSGIIKVNDAWIDPTEETRFVYKRLYGECVSGPLSFSQEHTGDFEPVGIPEPKAYVGHDTIQQKRNYRDRQWDNKDYRCTTFEGYTMMTLQDYAQRVDVRQGEQIYFNEFVTERENFLGKNKEGKLLYRCRVDNIICSIREGKTWWDAKGNAQTSKEIKTQGTWLLVEPVMETWEEITTESGIIMKVAPEAKYLMATVSHSARKEWIGKTILYLPDSNWGITIEGKEYFGIREKEVICIEAPKVNGAHSFTEGMDV